MKLPLLYSRTSVGNIQTWQIEISENKFRTHEGILDGKITTTLWTEVQGKNIGKKNETSPAEQALKEAKSKHKKKKDEGYCEDITDIDKSKFFEPMLAKEWDDEKHRVVYPVYSQPKLDGQRCVISKDGMFSRNGKPILSAPHIFEIVKPIFEREPDLVLDGELYNHDLSDNFNEIISHSRKTKLNEEDLLASAEQLQYWVYDCRLATNSKLKFSERSKLLEKEINRLKSEKIKFVDTEIIYDEEELTSIYKKYLKQNFEGQMVRVDAEYENKRSKYLLKRKMFIEKEFEIEDIEQGKGNSAGIAARVILKTDDGKLFGVGVIGDHKYARKLYQDRASIRGKKGTVVFQNLTPDGIPRFGKLKTVRDYE